MPAVLILFRNVRWRVVSISSPGVFRWRGLKGLTVAQDPLNSLFLTKCTINSVVGGGQAGWAGACRTHPVETPELCQALVCLTPQKCRDFQQIFVRRRIGGPIRRGHGKFR